MKEDYRSHLLNFTIAVKKSWETFKKTKTTIKCSHHRADIIPAIKTDHSAITLSLNSFKDQPLGPSYWKFNFSLLDDDTNIQLVNSEFPKWITEFSEVNDKRLLWDLVKYKIRQTTIQYSKIIAKKRKVQLQQSEEVLLVKQSEEICNNNPSEENVTKLDEASSEYEALYDYRGKWYEQGEKNSKYFLNVETNNNYLITESEVVTGKSQTETLPY